ncbi:MAG: response regulator [Patescibacteria group bacterium]
MDTPKKHSILIVDDDKFLLDMYAMKFTETGYTVATAPNAQEALERLSKDEAAPDIVMLDIVMPGMDGFELLTEIKKRKLAKDSSLIVLSNLGQKEDIDKGVALGVDGYIIKASCTPTEVTKKVGEIVEKHAKR